MRSHGVLSLDKEGKTNEVLVFVSCGAIFGFQMGDLLIECFISGV